MAEDSDLERTEPASARRLERAREDGDVPRSRELSTCTILLASGLGLWFLGDRAAVGLRSMLSGSLQIARPEVYDFNLLLQKYTSSVMDLLVIFAPLAVLLIVVALGSPALIGGWLFTAKALQPNFGRLNPLSGLGNMISVRAGVELLKAIGKALLVGVFSWMVVKSQFTTMLNLMSEPVNNAVSHVVHIMLMSFMTIVCSLIVIALIDAPYQMWQHASRLKMTRQELRQEAKESDGNPEIKAKIRAQQREMARRRMMSKVPTADVVVTNPTHYAVALKYTDNSMRAPRVVAKGADVVAARIRELAEQNNVPILEAPPLARALYRHTELDQEIPQALYTAVAEVLAYVYQLKIFRQRGGDLPVLPTDLDVPEQLDPASETALRADDE